MKRIATSIMTVALACLGMAVEAKAANNRYYKADINITDVTGLSTTNFQLKVTNDLLNGPTHPIEQIQITLPLGFTLVPFGTNTTGVTPPNHWTVLPIVGQVITLNTNGTFQLLPGKSVTIGLN